MPTWLSHQYLSCHFSPIELHANGLGPVHSLPPFTFLKITFYFSSPLKIIILILLFFLFTYKLLKTDI